MFKFFFRMNKVAVITGSNKGIGFAIAKGLTENFDGDIYLTSRNVKLGLAAVNELLEEGVTVSFHQLDIDEESSITRFAEFIKENYGGIDILVNNAGIAFKRDATDPISHQAKVTLKTNYFGTKMACKHFFPLLKSGARVVNLSSNCGFLPLIPGHDLKKKLASSDSTLSFQELDAMMEDFIDSTEDGSHEEKGWPNGSYVVSKVGLSALTRIQQREMDKDSTRTDIAINHVHPGYVDTDMSSHKGPLTPEEGAKSSLFAATLPQGTNIKGKYIWHNCELVDWVNGPKPDV